jgi:hypothetical protein
VITQRGLLLHPNEFPNFINPHTLAWQIARPVVRNPTASCTRVDIELHDCVAVNHRDPLCGANVPTLAQ